MNITVQKPEWGVNYALGYTGFNVRKKDFIAQGISWFEHWDRLPKLPCPTHCYVITGEDTTEEAFGGGVHAGTLSAYLDDPDVSVLVRSPRDWCVEMGRTIASEAISHDGHKYDYFLIFAQALNNSLLGHAFDWATRGWSEQVICELADNHNADMCSELVAWSYSAVPRLHGRGILRRHPASIKPVDLFLDQVIYAPGAVELVR